MGFYLIQPLFSLGDLLVSSGVEASGLNHLRYVRRHQSGDWGDVCDEDAAANWKALSTDEAILSQYAVTLTDGTKTSLSVMTERLRVFTVLFLTSESPVY